MKPLVSIIIPIYNVEPYLRECLNSVAGQTYRNLETILVDDGSTDDSGAICDEYAASYSEITVIHQANRGLSAARNAGIDRALGEYVWFVDSDDWLERDAVRVLVDIAFSYTCDAVTLNMLVSSNICDYLVWLMEGNYAR